jgi:hypothetical protein
MSHELYRSKLSHKMENKTFAEVARIIYKNLGAIAFAIDFNCNGKTIIRLNPSNFIINNIERNCINLYCICPDPSAAEGIELLDMTNEEINRYKAQQV